LPKYLTAERIKRAIEALSDTRAKATLLDFLIVKRTLVIKNKLKVAITTGEPAYLQATKELAGVLDKPKIDIGADKEIFNVFASLDTKQGYRSGKYISNGTGTTIGGNPWQTVIELSTDKPRQVSFRKGYEPHLADLLLKEASSKTKKPSLGETAIWNYRFADVDPILGAEADPRKRGKKIEQRFISDYGLSPTEVSELFEKSDTRIINSDLDGARADPRAYLPGLAAVPAATPAIPAQCSLDLTVALAAKPFVILTGITGTGKSRSILSLAEQLQNHYGTTVDGQIFRLVAIGPDWTSPKKLLGFRSPFGQERLRPDGSKTNESYEITDALRIILRACHPKSTKIPHFLIFDEMNLSHVERYFAPFLSLMEATNIFEDIESAWIVDRQSLVVISELLDLEDANSVEAQSASLLVAHDQPLTLPPNLFYVGTVNVDETTYMFSPKVLDRAHVLEVNALQPSKYIAGAGVIEKLIDLAKANELLREAIDFRETGGPSGDPAAILDLLTTKHGLSNTDVDKAKAITLSVLEGCYKLLKPTGFHFAYRVDKEVYEYMYVWTKAQLAIGVSPQNALDKWIEGLDRAIFQKILPKIHGNRTVVGDSLIALSAFLDGGDTNSVPPAKYTLVGNTVGIEPGEAIKLPSGVAFTRCHAKLVDMHSRLISRTYVSFVT
jgi:hypothetical protein